MHHLNNDMDDYWMSRALLQAGMAAEMGEVPVGAVLVTADNQLLACDHNRPISACDPTAHAEIMVLRVAARQLNNYRLPDTTLYVTLEPCTMCVGALVQARIKRVVYGVAEPKTGAIESAHQLFRTGKFNHLPELSGGIRESECAHLLRHFFAQRRQPSSPGAAL